LLQWLHALGGISRQYPFLPLSIIIHFTGLKTMKLSLKQGLLCVAALSAAAWQLAISAPAPEVDHAQMPQIIDDLPADYAADLTAEQRTLVDRGRYIARLGDCVACHTGNKTQPMGGGLALETPFGKIYSTNISPDADTGMGKYSFEQFDRAMRKGVAADAATCIRPCPIPPTPR
jgi:thiosulfate dehydrogenase